jgi:branched-chain amino acid aminotransferase
MKVYINGKFVDEAEAVVSVFDRSFLYGDGIFEGIGVYRGRILYLKEHVERFYRSAVGVGIAIPEPPAAMEKIILETARVNAMTTGYLRPLVTRGVGPLGLSSSAQVRNPNVLVIPQGAGRIKYEGDVPGFTAAVVTVRRTPPDCLDPRIKSNNYLNNILAQREAQLAGSDLAVMLDARGFIAEGQADNLFCVTSGRLRAPHSHNALDGITRRVVLDLGREMTLNPAEEDLTVYDFLHADELFATNTLDGIRHIARFQGVEIGGGAMGPITAELRRRYVEHALVHGTPVSPEER